MKSGANTKLLSRLSWVLLLPARFVYAQSQYTVASIMENIQDKLLDPLIQLLFVLATVVFLWGVVEYVVQGAASEDKRTQGKKHMLWGIVGLTIMVAVWGIVRLAANLICGDAGCPTQYTP